MHSLGEANIVTSAFFESAHLGQLIVSSFSDASVLLWYAPRYVPVVFWYVQVHDVGRSLSVCQSNYTSSMSVFSLSRSSTVEMGRCLCEQFRVLSTVSKHCWEGFKM